MKLLKPMWVAKEGHPIFSIDIHPDGTRFATGGQGNDSGRIVIWNMKSILSNDESPPKLLSQMDHHLACVNCVRWSNSGKFLASGGDDKLVMIWEKSSYGGGAIFGGGGKVNVESWRCKHTLRRHEGDILDLAWSQHDTLIATASVDNSVIVWNAENFPEVVKILKGHTGLVKGVIFDPVGKYLASQSDDKTLRLWRTSDWEIDSVITEPFEECGATTHFLRPGWSPDGSFLVSAHAMNGGGPTAQIIDRHGWKKVKDFVGHKKAVSCVRFHNQIFQRDGKSEFYVTVALGSRDRGFSVWCTNLKRPYFVVNDVFDQSVLDLSWRQNVLMACSMDGSVAACVLDDKELGNALSEAKTYEFMSNTYGKSYGQKPKSQRNGTLIAENPEILLKFQADETVKTNGVTTATTTHKERPRGPTDKQIEARTSDGKRRITPIFIPPTTMGNGLPLGTGEFGSSSSTEKSKIAVETREETVDPNISPTKNEKGNTVNVITAVRKKKKNEEVTATNGTSESTEAKTIAVKRKPSSTTPQQQPPSKKPAVEPPKRDSSSSSISSSSSSSSSSNSSSSSSSSNDSCDKTDGAQQSKPPSSSSSVKSASITKEERLKDSKLKKPDLVKRKPTITNDDNAKNGGENKDNDKNDSDDDVVIRKPLNVKRRGRPWDDDPPSVVPQVPNLLPPPPPSSLSAHSHKAALLPPLTLRTDNHVYSFPDNLSVIVTNNYQSSNIIRLHHVKCKSKTSSWETLFSNPITSVVHHDKFIVIVVGDGSINVFDPSEGIRLLPPIMLPSLVSKIASSDDKLAVVTSEAGFYLWDFQGGRGSVTPKVLMKNESLIPFITPNTIISKLSFLQSDQPVIITSDGKSFTYSADLGSWLKLTDASDVVHSLAGYRGGVSVPKGHCPLADLNRQTEVRGTPSPLVTRDRVDDPTKRLASIAHCETQRCAAQYLNSPQEYKYWLLAKIRHLCLGEEDKELRLILKDLLGPVHSDPEKTSWHSTVIGCDKRTLLKDALKIVGESVNFQRLFAEFNNQLNSLNDLNDASSLLNIR